MYGAIIGDMAGSIYEFHSWHGSWEDIPLHNGQGRFTDDTVMSVAVANALREADGNEKLFSNKLIDNFHQFGHMYPLAGYGGRFAHWLISGQREPYKSFGNGSAMRVSPVGWSFDSLEDTEKFAALSAAVTHNHPEGIKGAQAVAAAIFLARTGADKKAIKDYVTSQYAYDLDRSLNEIQKSYKFEVSCQKSVPEAIIAFLEGDNYEDTIKKAIWLGGDADTQAAIAGSIAEAFTKKFRITSWTGWMALTLFSSPKWTSGAHGCVGNKPKSPWELKNPRQADHRNPGQSGVLI